MAGRIPQNFIDDLMQRVDIVEVIDSRVPLKKAGREYQACCPFHNEKTPSFTVSPTKQFYYCFGCGAHGTALGFLMDYEHLDFVDAIEDLARSAGLEVPREEGPGGSYEREDSTGPLYDLLAQAAHFFRQQLRQHSEAARAVDYLKGRGLSGEIAQAFGLGYAPPGWDNLLKALGQDAAQQTLMERAGLLIKKDGGGLYDRFRDRVMFPIHDRRGRVIGFGGRVLGDDTPKYLNSPETPVFHKGRELYGLFEARKRERKLDRLLVVEGYMDVVALAQYGINNVVATLGTATTREHLEQLYRAVPEVVFCFDGDRAGKAAAWRALENALPVLEDGRQARFLMLPGGEDPDSLVRKEGTDAFKQRTGDSIPLSEFLYAELCGQVDMSSMDGRTRLVNLAKPLLKQLPAGVFQRMMVDRLEELAKLPRNALAELHGQPIQEVTHKAPSRPARSNNAMSPLRRLVSLLLHEPRLAGLVENPAQLAEVHLQGAPLLVELIDFLKDRPHIHTGAVIEHWHGTDSGRHLAKLAAEPTHKLVGDLEKEFLDGINHLLAKPVDQRREARFAELSRKQPSQLTAIEKEELKSLLRPAERPH
ncbi:MAG: DNA primase [Gammaproteobacteria bacterium]|nr:DNA primase [Gammaproteobacteria bacterium]MBU2478275.1 DNA primase [Gammaproteobacteria bacterium]